MELCIDIKCHSPIETSILPHFRFGFYLVRKPKDVSDPPPHSGFLYNILKLVLLLSWNLQSANRLGGKDSLRKELGF